MTQAGRTLIQRWSKRIIKVRKLQLFEFEGGAYRSACHAALLHAENELSQAWRVVDSARRFKAGGTILPFDEERWAESLPALLSHVSARGARRWPALEEALRQEADLLKPSARGPLAEDAGSSAPPTPLSGEPPGNSLPSIFAKATTRDDRQAVLVAAGVLISSLAGMDSLYLSISRGQEMLEQGRTEDAVQEAKWVAHWFCWLYDGVRLGNAALQRCGHRFVEARVRLTKPGERNEFKCGRQHHASGHHAALEFAEQVLEDVWKIADPAITYQPFPDLPAFSPDGFAVGCERLFRNGPARIRWPSPAQGSVLNAAMEQERIEAEAQLAARAAGPPAGTAEPAPLYPPTSSAGATKRLTACPCHSGTCSTRCAWTAGRVTRSSWPRSSTGFTGRQSRTTTIGAAPSTRCAAGPRPNSTPPASRCSST
jgi:hypothetical protein